MLDRAWCAALITAAGASSRMGKPKALVEFDGQTLLALQLSALEGFGQRIVVLGADAGPIRQALEAEGSGFADETTGASRAVDLRHDVTVLENSDWASGRSSSLRCGFRAVSAQARAVLVAGVDQPLDTQVVDALLEGFDASRHAYAVPVAGDRRGHPLLLNAALLDSHLRDLPDDRTLRDVTERFADSSLSVPVQSAATLANLNRDSDVVDLARKWLGNGI